MIFYNGFNMLVDTLLAFGVWFITYRHAWWTGYQAGIADATDPDDLMDWEEWLNQDTKE
jgi:hypothetical protein